jgi:hypothetical protein
MIIRQYSKTVTQNNAVEYNGQICNEIVTEEFVPATSTSPRKSLSKPIEYKDVAGNIISTKQYYSDTEYYTDSVYRDSYQKVTSASGETVPVTQFNYDAGGRQNYVICGNTIPNVEVKSETATQYDGFNQKVKEGCVENYAVNPVISDNMYFYKKYAG